MVKKKKRKQIKDVKSDLSVFRAKQLARKVFQLRQDLNITYKQMAKDSGLSVNQLYRLKCIWVSGKARQPQQMLAEHANKLIKFWNKNYQSQLRKKVKAKLPKPRLTEEAIFLLEILLEQFGLAQTRKLLAERGKANILRLYLQSLPPGKLADMV